MSLNISVCNIGIGLGTLAGGRVVDHYGAGAVAYGSAALAVIALAIALSLMAAHSSRR
jgi:MFS transporter, DHA1 family, inner membrane transport protein